MKVPFVDLTRQFISLEDDLVEIFRNIGRSGNYIMGDTLAEFEQKMASFLGVKHILGVADGSDSLFLIMHALGIGKGDEVITAPNSFIASAWTIIATGAKPVFVDVDDDLNINVDLIESAITKKTKAILPVHLAGKPAKMDEIKYIAEKNNLFVLEDAAQAIGAKYKGNNVGGLGLAAGFSMHPLKNLGLYGDGGFLSTNDSILYQKIKILRNHGLVNRDECTVWGYNSRLDSLQAAFASLKLDKLNCWNDKCRSIANQYNENLIGVDLPLEDVFEECVYHNYIIKTKNRDEMIENLYQNGIETKIHYPIPIHLQKAAKNLGYKHGDFPKTENFSKTMLSLPIFPELTQNEVDFVIENVNNFIIENQ